ncbi:MAG: molybdenum cofactor guanylyltransferase [Candidatus Alcyoniella australis]|nr:molybdenum cofactor guanylyltransferase [Candidatus Alcyoniella australis]
MLSAVILAGGRSRRMGRDKCLIELGGQPLIELLLRELQQAADQVLIAANHVERFASLNVRVVSDIHPGNGALAGLHAGLWACDGERAFVCACDMPRITAEVVRTMFALAPEADVVVPRLGEYLEPLCAVYSCSCLPHIERSIMCGERRLVSFYDKVRVVEVGPQDFPDDPLLKFTTNINTPEDLEQLKSRSG